ncbi:MAG: type IX secretion system membrane protein PorP/SprF [Bacteroidetes bacterium]|nr:type IX secretion system membrane protein PorP/SprF [Bacteroidota bacterium]
MRNILFCILFLFFSQAMQAQQFPLFTNYEFNRIAYNPAVPVVSGSVVGNLLYRQQWAGLDKAPVTQFAGLRFGFNKIPLNIGGYYFQDEAGLLQRKAGMALLSYSQPISSKMVVSVGLSGALNHVSLGNDYIIETQVDHVVTNAMEGRQTYDINFGVHLQMQDFFFGFSMPQFLEQDLGISEADNKTQFLRHYFAHAGYTFRINDNMRFEPSALVKFVKGAPVQVDVTGRLLFNRFWLGGNYRYDDAVSALLGITFNNIEVAYAYDFTTSHISKYSSGSHEIGLKFLFKLKRDKDKDGISDQADKCPDEPGSKENMGCPEDVLAEEFSADNDKDGIPNNKDKCPDRYGLPEYQGCPLADLDKDGIRDDVDKCPKEFGVATNAGCPINDRDQDGVVDKFDPCPDEPGPAMFGGCPDKDSDEDGIVDRLDPCPDDAGPKSNIGCPITKTVVRENSKMVSQTLGFSIRNVYFDTDSYSLRREHQIDLDRLGAYMGDNPDSRVKMSGHTDERADNDYNVTLSKNRVGAVIGYLIRRGVSRKQIIADYYGETQPADGRKDEVGFQLNRRVELELILE